MWIYDPYLSTLNDRISESETIIVSELLLPQEIQNLKDYIWSILHVAEALNELPFFPERTLNVLDFDDTMYSRHMQLQLPILQDNRWVLWNYVIENILGSKNVLEQFYSSEYAVKRLLWVLWGSNELHDAIILTAWQQDWQTQKCKAIGLNTWEVPISIVEKSSEKPRRLIEYIISLGYIPGKIIVYEDRPEYFLELWEGLSKLLKWVEIVVDRIELDQTWSMRQIKNIGQTIFKPEHLI